VALALIVLIVLAVFWISRSARSWRGAPHPADRGRRRPAAPRRRADHDCCCPVSCLDWTCLPRASCGRPTPAFR